MAAEWIDVDKEGLYIVARLRQDFEEARTPNERDRKASEIRQQESRFGLSALDRRRLQWEIEKAESAEERTKERRKRTYTRKKQEEAGNDPRKLLKVL